MSVKALFRRVVNKLESGRSQVGYSRIVELMYSQGQLDIICCLHL